MKISRDTLGRMDFPARQLGTEEFPELLREISDVPKRLYVRGALPAPDTHRYLCVVGSRAASPYGRRVCQSLIEGLTGFPVAIVSGLALGLDALAHEAALAAGLPTVAVLPAGVGDADIYPRLNYELAQRILKRGGALISEQEDGAPLGRWSFPVRDRIMAGLSRASLILEAGEKSGTLITARLALEYGREVLAVPHELGAQGGAGGNRLIREGATLVRGREDVLEALGLKVLEDGAERRLPGDLSEAELAVFAALTGPLDKDTLLERAALSAQEANIALSSLLIRGLIAERLGKIERI